MVLYSDGGYTVSFEYINGLSNIVTANDYDDNSYDYDTWDIFPCNSYDECGGKTFTCAQNKNCVLKCTASYACWYSKFICSDNNRCHVICGDYGACGYLTVCM